MHSSLKLQRDSDRIELTDFVESLSQVLKIVSGDLCHFALHAVVPAAVLTMQKTCQKYTQRVCVLCTMFAHSCISMISKSTVDTTGKNTPRNTVTDDS